MARFVSNGMAQVEIASACSIQELRGIVLAIRDGSAPIPVPKPAPDPVTVIEPPTPTMTVFMLRSANYRDDDGRKWFAGQYEDAMMPVPTAQRALRHGVAVSVADPRRAQLRGARGGDFNPLAPDVVDLDAIEEPKGVPYIGPTRSWRQQTSSRSIADVSAPSAEGDAVKAGLRAGSRTRSSLALMAGLSIQKTRIASPLP